MSVEVKTRAIGSHHSAKAMTTSVITPPHILSALGEFDLDPCASIPQPWPTAKRMLTIEDDGHKHKWHGRVWLNPPYGSELATWLMCLSDHGNGIALIFARTETQAFCDFVWPKASGLLFIAGRLHFHRPDGSRYEANSGVPSVLIAYGEANAECLRTCSIPGAYVETKPRSQPLFAGVE